MGKKRRDAARAGFITTSMRLPAVCACRAARTGSAGLATLRADGHAGPMHGVTGLPPYLRIQNLRIQISLDGADDEGRPGHKG